jgi:hypothetical protein
VLDVDVGLVDETEVEVGLAVVVGLTELTELELAGGEPPDAPLLEKISTRHYARHE